MESSKGTQNEISEGNKVSTLDKIRLAANIGCDLIALVSVIMSRQHATQSVIKIAKILETEGHCPQSASQGVECKIYYEYTMNLFRFGMAGSEDYFASCIYTPPQDDTAYYTYADDFHCEKIPNDFKPFDTCTVPTGDFNTFVWKVGIFFYLLNNRLSSFTILS